MPSDSRGARFSENGDPSAIMEAHPSLTAADAQWIATAATADLQNDLRWRDEADVDYRSAIAHELIRRRFPVVPEVD